MIPQGNRRLRTPRGTERTECLEETIIIASRLKLISWGANGYLAVGQPILDDSHNVLRNSLLPQGLNEAGMINMIESVFDVKAENTNDKPAFPASLAEQMIFRRNMSAFMVERPLAAIYVSGKRFSFCAVVARWSAISCLKTLLNVESIQSGRYGPGRCSVGPF
jgi:hypothetical protein